MNSDLIFHIIPKRKWHSLNQDGFYRPVSAEEDGIVCVDQGRLNDYLNEHYHGRKNLLLLVVDRARLVNRAEKGVNQGTVLVRGGINVDAILDKIRIDCNKDGGFDIEIENES